MASKKTSRSKLNVEAIISSGLDKIRKELQAAASGANIEEEFEAERNKRLRWAELCDEIKALRGKLMEVEETSANLVYLFDAFAADFDPLQMGE
jgi:hypothetical protein